VLKLAAFADEISPQLDEQIAVCRENGVTHFELRGVYGKNVLDFDRALREEIKSKLSAHGMGVISIGSPIGKVKIDEPWEPHFERFKIAVDAAEFFGSPILGLGFRISAEVARLNVDVVWAAIAILAIVRQTRIVSVFRMENS